jgi:Glycoside hydrolase family 127 C-terminal domain
VTLTAIPYFQWDNRGPGAMRVWIPASQAAPAPALPLAPASPPGWP